MIKNQRPSLFFKINNRTVQFFNGEKTYVSTGDSEDIDSGESITFYDRPSRANVQPKINDIIFAKMQGAEKTFQIDEKMSNMVFSTGFFDVSSTHIYPRFLYYLIKSDEYKSYRDAYSEGTTQISITDSRLKRIYVTYETNYKKQEKISNLLDKKIKVIDDLIINLELQINEYNTLKQSFIDNSINTLANGIIKSYKGNEYEISKLFYYINGMKDGTHGSYGRTNEGEMLLSAKNVFNDGIHYGDSESLISYSDYYDITKCGYPKKNDILFTTVGTIGRTCVYDFDKPLAFQRSVLFIRPQKRINSDYLCYVFKSAYFMNQLNLYVKTSAQSGIYGGDFSRLNIPVPSLDIQKETINYLNNRIRIIDKIIDIKNKKINKINEYKNSLIYEYVSGKKVV